MITEKQGVNKNLFANGQRRLSVPNAQVTEPAAQYAFIDFQRYTLINGSNLTASSFRTDDYAVK